MPRSLHRDFVKSVLLCVGLALCAGVLEHIEIFFFRRAWIDVLVFGILTGAIVRSAWTPSSRWRPGISFCATMLLEIAIVLLGLSFSFRMVANAGYGLFIGIVLVVGVALTASYALGRLFGLPRRMAILVACGNSICGNSAIAAIAPIIGAKSEDVAASIAFTAVLGIGVVLALPFLMPVLGLSTAQYGAFAGLTVYAVPQVLAATMSAGALAVQMGTFVKLIRVLTLGPVALVLSLLTNRRKILRKNSASWHMSLRRYVPWFIIGFLALAVLRSLELVPPVLLEPTAAIAKLFTAIAMAALGLGVDIREVARAGGRVTAAVSVSLLVLGIISLVLIRMVHLP